MLRGEVCIRILVLEGSPYEMGYAHGSLFASDIREFTDQFLGQSDHVFGCSNELIMRHARSLESYVEPELLEEMKGVADGAGISFDQALALSTFPDTDAMNNARAIHCSNFVLLPEVTADSTLYHARTMDFPHKRKHWKKSCLIQRRRGGRVTVSMGFVGQVGLVTGMSLSGLMMTHVTAYPNSYVEEGVPVMVAMRQALDRADTIDASAACLESYRYMSGGNILLSDARTGTAACVETCADGTERVYPEEGFLVMSGMYQSKRLRKGQHAPPSDITRHVRKLMLIRAKAGSHTSATTMDILHDRFDLIQGAETLAPRCIFNLGTVYNFLGGLGAGRFWLSLGPPPAPPDPFTRFDVETFKKLPVGATRIPLPLSDETPEVVSGCVSPVRRDRSGAVL